MELLSYRRYEMPPRLMGRFEPPPPKMADELRRLQKEHGLTGQFVAEKIGCAPSHYSSMVRGSRYPNTGQRRALERLYGLPSGYLTQVKEEHDLWKMENGEAFDAIRVPVLMVLDDPEMRNLLKAIDARDVNAEELRRITAGLDALLGKENDDDPPNAEDERRLNRARDVLQGNARPTTTRAVRNDCLA